MSKIPETGIRKAVEILETAEARNLLQDHMHHTHRFIVGHSNHGDTAYIIPRFRDSEILKLSKSLEKWVSEMPDYSPTFHTSTSVFQKLLVRSYLDITSAMLVL